MDTKMLRRQITRYSNDEVRFKAKADRCYAAWKEYGEKTTILIRRGIMPKQNVPKRSDKNMKRCFDSKTEILPVLFNIQA